MKCRLSVDKQVVLFNNCQLIMPRRDISYHAQGRYQLSCLREISVIMPRRDISYHAQGRYQLPCLGEISVIMPRGDISYHAQGRYQLPCLGEISVIIPRRDISYHAQARYQLSCLGAPRPPLVVSNQNACHRFKRKVNFCYMYLTNKSQASSMNYLN